MTAVTDRPVSDDRRYSRLAMALHWIIAALIITQIGLGLYMNEILPDHSPAQDRIQDLHVSIGLTTLVLILVRIGIRLTHRPPNLPAGMPAWERGLAHATHVLFYVLMLAMPLTGWALMSTRLEMIQIWGVAWPMLPGVPAHVRPLSSALKTIHISWLMWTTLATLALHVAGALKHQFDGHPVLWRMAPFLKRPVA